LITGTVPPPTVEIDLRHTARFASNANVPEAPAEVLEVPHGLLSRIRESDADQLAQAVGASLDHLRPWLSWATQEAADPQAQGRRCRGAEAHWADGCEYLYVLRPQQSAEVIGGFDLWRIGPRAVEIGYWVHPAFTGRGYATACARALTQAGLALSDVNRVGWATGLTGSTNFRLRPPHTPAVSRSGLWNAPGRTDRINRRCMASGLTYC
jgi:RimJ/RimL family protein N-acetyltransferase